MGRPRPLRAAARRDRRLPPARDPGAAQRGAAGLARPTPRSPRPPSPARPSTRAPSRPSARGASCSPTSASRRSRPSAASACRARWPRPAPRCATSARRRSATSPTSRPSSRATSQDVLTIDTVTRRNLELVENLQDGGRRGTLLDVLDHTRTAMGGRLLREWILRPLVELERIQDRLDAVEELAFRAVERGRRARRSRACRTSTGSSPASCSAARARATSTPSPARCARCPPSRRRWPSAWRPWFACRRRSSTPWSTCATRSRAPSSTSPRRSSREGGFVRDGVDPELDALRATSRGGRETIAAIEERERHAHRDRLAQGALQPRVRLLHRGQQAEPAAGAARLHPQADDRGRRALRDTASSRSTRSACCAPTS